MRPSPPAFSELYKAHVEAERRFVSETMRKKEATTTGNEQDAGGQAPSLTIEEAFHAARTHSKGNTTAPAASGGKA